MAFVRDGLLVNLFPGELYDRLLGALDQIAAPAGLAGRGGPVGIITSQDAPAAIDSVLPQLRLWTSGRGPGTSGPFHDPTVRHVLGAMPVVEPSHLSSTLRHVIDGEPIGMHDIVPQPTGHISYHVTTWAEREQLRQALPSFLCDSSLSPEIAQELSDLIDELVANAVYDAPVEDGHRLYAATSRRNAVPLIRPVDIEVSVDRYTAAIAVRDQFGSLAAKDIVANLARCFAGQGGQIDQKEGGAGLGIFLALTGSSRLVFNIRPGLSTEAILARRHDQRRSEFHGSTPTLNICVVGDKPDLRRQPRHLAQLVAVLTVQGVGVPAVMLDVTANGAFVQPLAQVSLAAGEQVGLTLFDPAVYVDDGEEIQDRTWQMQTTLANVPAVVRWVGQSREHLCFGAGLEFAERVQALIDLAKK